jgi:hypothetical protein
MQAQKYSATDRHLGEALKIVGSKPVGPQAIFRNLQHISCRPIVAVTMRRSSLLHQ